MKLGGIGAGGNAKCNLGAHRIRFARFDHCVAVAVALDVLVPSRREMSLACGETITVRVAKPVRPAGSVTRYVIVCVPGAVVAILAVPSVDVALSTRRQR